MIPYALLLCYSISVVSAAMIQRSSTTPNHVQFRLNDALISRRQVLSQTSLMWLLPMLQQISNANDDDSDLELSTQLGKDRIGMINSVNPNKLVSSPKLSFPFSSNEPLYYPTFLFGSWNVTATLKRMTRIQDSNIKEHYVTENDSNSNTYNIQLQYFATLANSIQNQIIMNLGTGIPETKIIANRAYNLPSELILLLLLYNGTMYIPSISIPSNTSTIEWDYRSKVPTRVSWINDKGIDPSKCQRFERETIDYETEYSSNDMFATSEQQRIRIIEESNPTLSKTDFNTETITEYHKVTDNYVQAKSRIVIRDDPTTISSTIMKILDYDLSMYRMVQAFNNINDNTMTNRPCVETPNGIVQCY